MTGRRARRVLDRMVRATSIEEVLACRPDVRADVYEALLELQVPSAWWQKVAAAVAKRRSVTAAYVVDRAMAWLATLRELRRHDLYAFFGVEPGATADDIRNRWRTLAKRYHPDHGGTDAVLFRRLQDVYEILSDPVQRMRYEDGWRRRHGPTVARITAGARPASGRRRGSSRRRRVQSATRRLRAWSRTIGGSAGRTLRAVALGAALVAVARFGRLPALLSPTPDGPSTVTEAPARRAAVTPRPAAAPIAVAVPAEPLGESVAESGLMMAEAEPVATDEMTLLPEPIPALEPSRSGVEWVAAAEAIVGELVWVASADAIALPVVSIASSPQTTTPATRRSTPTPVPATARIARAAVAPNTVTPATNRHVAAAVVPATPPAPVVRLAAAVALPPPTSAPAQEQQTSYPPWIAPVPARASTPPPVALRPTRTAKAPPPGKPDKHAKAEKNAKPEKNAKLAAAKRPAPRTAPKAAAAARARPAPVIAPLTGMAMALTAPEPVDLRSAQGFVREFARRYSAHEAMGLLELFAPGGSADGRHGVAIADGFGATFRRLGDVRLEPAHVELQPMATGAVVRADYVLIVPGRDTIHGRAQWLLVREGGAIRATQMLSSTVPGAR